MKRSPPSIPSSNLAPAKFKKKKNQTVPQTKPIEILPPEEALPKQVASHPH